MADNLPLQPWQSDYQSAQRRRKLAETLMQGSLTPSQGGMVGRYYVGEGIGGGMQRIGQALLARNFNNSADETEAGALAARQKMNEDAFTSLAEGITPSETSQPTPQQIGMALMKYQGATGQTVPDAMIKMLNPKAMADARAYGSVLWKNGQPYQLTDNGQPIPLGDGWDMPTRTIDTNSAVLVTPTMGAQGPIATYQKSVNPDKIYDVQTAPGKAAAVATATAQAEQQITQQKQAKGSAKVLPLLDEADGLLGNATGSGAGHLIDKGAAFFGASTEGAGANARLKILETKIMMDQPRMEGPQSNTDVQLYRDAAANLGNPDVPVEVRREALKTLRMLHERYAGVQSKPAGTRPPLDSFKKK